MLGATPYTDPRFFLGGEEHVVFRVVGVWWYYDAILASRPRSNFKANSKPNQNSLRGLRASPHGAKDRSRLEFAAEGVDSF